MFQIHLEIYYVVFYRNICSDPSEAGDFWPEYSRGLFEPDSLLSARVPQRRPKLPGFTRRREAVSRFCSTFEVKSGKGPFPGKERIKEDRADQQSQS